MKKVLTLRIDAGLHLKLKGISEIMDVSMNSLGKHAVENFVGEKMEEYIDSDTLSYIKVFGLSEEEFNERLNI